MELKIWIYICVGLSCVHAAPFDEEPAEDTYSTLEEIKTDLLSKDAQDLPDFIHVKVPIHGKIKVLKLKKNRKITNSIPVSFSGSEEKIYISPKQDYAVYQDIANFASFTVIAQQTEDGIKHVFEGSLISDSSMYSVQHVDDGNSQPKSPMSAQNNMDTGKRHDRYNIQKVTDTDKIPSSYSDSNPIEEKLLQNLLKDVKQEQFRRKREVGIDYFSFHVEVLVLLDHTIWDYFRAKNSDDAAATAEISYYYSHAINTIDLYYKTIDPAVWEYSIDIWLKEIVISKTQGDSSYVGTVTPNLSGRDFVDPSAILTNLGNWWSTNSKTIFDPDHIMHFTRYDLRKDGSNGIVGLAYVGGICLPGLAVSTQEDTGFLRWLTAAHELGHNLGASHDGDANTCPSSEVFIMQPGSESVPEPKDDSTLIANAHSFSDCTKTYFKQTLFGSDNDGYPRMCLTNQVCTHPTSLTNIATLPGQTYTKQEQCELYLGAGTQFCEFASIPLCVRMACQPPGSDSCFSSDFLTADGTDCDTNKWCIMGECVDKTTNPAPGFTADPDCVVVSIPSSVPGGCTDGTPNIFIDGTIYTDCTPLIDDHPYLCFRYDTCCETCAELGLYNGTWHAKEIPPVDGDWAQWTSWGGCSLSCGTGSQSRSRTCTDPAPDDRGAPCDGADSGGGQESRDCNTEACPPVPGDGNWATWGDWSTCTLTCGTGTQTRTRTCTDPPPTNGGAECTGSGEETQNCNEQLCPVDGIWGAWEAWSTCSVTCDDGTQTRSRECNNPAPANGGASCPGSDTGTQDCNDGACPGVTGVTPVYGPKAGGTEITLDYTPASNDVEMYIGEVMCTLQSTLTPSSRSAIFESPDLASIGASAAMTQPIRVVIGDAYNDTITQTFEYRDNPVITDIQPRTTIAKGGITQTITGTNLNSVSKPQMFVTNQALPVDVDTLAANQITDCTVKSGTQMTCPTPPIPDSRRKRSTGHRVERATEQAGNFNFGIILDGFDDYENLPASLPDMSVFTVYTSPTIEQFTDSPLVVPYGANNFTIEGANLDGVADSLYTVMLGSIECPSLTVTSTTIQCEVTGAIVESLDGAAVTVMVKIGDSLEYTPGVVLFETAPEDTPPSSSLSVNTGIIIGGVLSGLMLLGILVVVFVLIRGEMKYRYWLERKTGVDPRRLFRRLPRIRRGRSRGGARNVYDNRGHNRY